MPKYLISGNYSAKGLEGLRAGGAKARQDAIATMMEPLGGTLESLFYAFGATDVYAVVDAPDDEAVAAVTMAINSSGSVTISTTKLLTVEQVDEALGRSVDYRPPGN